MILLSIKAGLWSEWDVLSIFYLTHIIAYSKFATFNGTKYEKNWGKLGKIYKKLDLRIYFSLDLFNYYSDCKEHKLTAIFGELSFNFNSNCCTDEVMMTIAVK